MLNTNAHANCFFSEKKENKQIWFKVRCHAAVLGRDSNWNESSRLVFNVVYTWLSHSTDSYKCLIVLDGSGRAINTKFSNK